MTKRWKRILTVSAITLVGIQFIPVSRTNPPVQTPIPAPDNVRTILRRACMDCHSNETVWPWYSHVAPVSWLVARDVHEAREHLNLSEWNRYNQKDRLDAADHIWREVSRGSMPMGIYVVAHSEANLSDEDKKLIEAWTKSLAGQDMTAQ